jgi:hypothetical protein
MNSIYRMVYLHWAINCAYLTAVLRQEGIID